MKAPDLTFGVRARSARYLVSIDLTPFRWRLGYWPLTDGGASIDLGPFNFFGAYIKPMDEATYEAAKVSA